MPYTSQHSFPTRRSSDLERPVPIRLLLTQTARDDIEKIADVSIVTPSGAYVPLRQVATFEVADGVASIVREGNIRYLALKFNVEGRDTGSVVRDSIAVVADNVTPPDGHYFEIGRASGRERA